MDRLTYGDKPWFAGHEPGLSGMNPTSALTRRRGFDYIAPSRAGAGMALARREFLEGFPHVAPL